MSVLEVRDLTIRFRQDGKVNEAVSHVSFSVAKGETVALVGESGSGKSVTALATSACCRKRRRLADRSPGAGGR